MPAVIAEPPWRTFPGNATTPPASALSTRFEQALAEDGTWAPRVLNADAGGVVAFPGKVRHGGSAITAGTRYIIPLFCNIDENASKKPPGYVLADLLPGLPDVE